MFPFCLWNLTATFQKEWLFWRTWPSKGIVWCLSIINLWWKINTWPGLVRWEIRYCTQSWVFPRQTKLLADRKLWRVACHNIPQLPTKACSKEPEGDFIPLVAKQDVKGHTRPDLYCPNGQDCCLSRWTETLFIQVCSSLQESSKSCCSLASTSLQGLCRFNFHEEFWKDLF